LIAILYVCLINIGSLDGGKDLGIPDGALINGKGPYQYKWEGTL